MYTIAELQRYRETPDGTDLIVHIPGLQLGNLFQEKTIKQAEMRFDDGRHISVDQRKKAYATIRDISDYTGFLPEECKEQMKYYHIAKTGCEYFSLSDCSMDMAREFINTLIEFSLEWGVPLSDLGMNRTDDIGRYLYFCIKHRKCCVCGEPGEIHHVDAIGMGNDRRRLDDSGHRKMCLCRKHHTIAHQRGVDAFEKMYKVYGIIIKYDSLADQEHDKGAEANAFT